MSSIGGAQRQTSGTSGGSLVGAWKCPKCGNVNWPQRVNCNTRSCGEARPESVGGAPAAESTPPATSSEQRPAKPSVLILAPARELAQQIHDEVTKFGKAAGIRASCIYGGVPKGEQAQSLSKFGADIVVATPGRCLDFLEKDKFLGVPLDLSSVTYLVLDEADRMLECGFLPEMTRIMERLPPSGSRATPLLGKKAGRTGELQRQTLLFTATWPQQLRKAADTFVSEAAVEMHVGQRQLGEPTCNKAVVQVCEVFQNHGSKLETLVQTLRKDLLRGTCLVFCKTRSRCDWLVKKLGDELEDCPWIKAVHSGMKQQEREAAMNSFRAITADSLLPEKASRAAMAKRGERKGAVLVATNVAGRGIDIPGIPLVVVYDFCTIDDYVHQIGRTGRAGASGRAVTFYVSGDGGAKELVGALEVARQAVPQALRDIAGQAGGEVAPKFGARDAEALEAGNARQGVKNKNWSKTRAS